MSERMNPRVKALWVAELRSGRHDQDTGQLDNGQGGKCCLGVLCAVAVAEGVIPAPRVEHDWGPIVVYGGAPGSTMYLPDEVREWAGLRQSDPVLRRDYTTDHTYYREQTASAVNDGGSTFETIAELIEGNL